MKLILMYLLLTTSMNSYSQSKTGGITGGYVGGIAGGYVDESKQSPELREQIKKFQQQKANVEGGIAGGAVSGGYVAGSQGGIAGGFIDSSLANCKKEDDGKTISCPDGEYIKSSSTNNSLRFPIKDVEPKKELQIQKPKSSATKQ